MAITAEHLTLLFDSDLPDPHLVLTGGDVRVMDRPGAEAGFVVASRTDLLAQHGGRKPTGAALDELAARLDSAVTSMGG